MTRMTRIAVAMLLAGAWLLAGCNDNDLGPTKKRPNLPPETNLSSGPPDSAYGANYKVHLYWSGADADGIIDHFDFILIDHPAFQDSISPSDSLYPSRVMVAVPTPDDPRWSATSSNDTLVVSVADTLRVDPRPLPGSNDGQLGQHNDFVRRQNFERWHTFFVRSVDNEGQLDLTPSYRSFNSTTLAPDVFLKSPINPQLEEFSGPRVIVFNWEGSDPVGDGTIIEPIASRWVMIPTRKTTATGYQGYPAALYAADVPWSQWRAWASTDGLGKRAIVRGLQPVQGTEIGFYLFAVQAMDEAGAVTPVFDATTGGKNNVARVLVNDQVGATLIVDERFLGTYSFVGGSRPVVLDVAASQPIEFRWRGDATSYGGEVVAFRYGWDIRNPQDDEEWQQPWCATCRTAPLRIFNSGTHRFFLELRDNAETITHAEIELVVNQVARTKDLLVVDDSVHFQDVDEILEDTRWRVTIDSLRARQNFDFDGDLRDIYDVSSRRNEPPPLNKVFDYKTVVWYVRRGQGGTAISTLARFFDPFVPRNQNAVVKFNFLSIFIDNGGEFWLSGQQPTEELWDFGLGAPQIPYPINVTNWDDYATPHPGEDSVGVRSFLWKLGVEVVDQGSGGRSTLDRNVLHHYCTGFRRATPQNVERQIFPTTQVLDHGHTLTVLTSDVEIPPPAGVTYTTDSQVGHTHDVTLTRAQLKTLARGGTLVVQTTSASAPQVHTHSVTIRDGVGLWGAPARLDPETSLWAQPSDPTLNPLGGRPNVEIYNMASFLANQQPPLQPDPKLWLALYNFMSPTVADPSTGLAYPQTGDGQPAIILRKAEPSDLFYSRALCGFEIFRLRTASQLAVSDNILLRQFRLGLPDGQ